MISVADLKVKVTKVVGADATGPGVGEFDPLIFVDAADVVAKVRNDLCNHKHMFIVGPFESCEVTVVKASCDLGHEAIVD